MEDLQTRLVMETRAINAAYHQLTPTAWAARISRLVAFAGQRRPNALTNDYTAQHGVKVEKSIL
jgi:hypothetical protein